MFQMNNSTTTNKGKYLQKSLKYERNVYRNGRRLLKHFGFVWD